MKNFNVGIIGCGFVGEGQAFSFSPISDVKVYDLDDKKSTASLEDTLKSDYIFVCVPTPMKKDGSQDTKFIEDFLSDFDDWTNSRQLRPSILSIKKQIKNIIIEETLENVNSSSNESDRSPFDSDGFNDRLNKVYEKFSDNLVRKIKQASNNGKDEKAISIINQIFLDD